jgi:hypothetical protein
VNDDSDEYEHDSEKDNAKDFALWKAYKPEVNTSPVKNLHSLVSMCSTILWCCAVYIHCSYCKCTVYVQDGYSVNAY